MSIDQRTTFNKCNGLFVNDGWKQILTIELSIACVAIVLNVVAIGMYLCSRPLQLMEHLAISFSAAVTINVIGLVISFSYRLQLSWLFKTTTAIECMKRMPSVVMYSIGELGMKTTALAAAIYSLSTVLPNSVRFRPGKRLLHLMLTVCLMMSMFSCIVCVLLAHFNGQKPICILCHRADIYGPTYEVIDLALKTLIGVATFLLYTISVTMALLRRRACDISQTEIMKGQLQTVKRTGWIVLFDFLIHTGPGLIQAITYVNRVLLYARDFTFIPTLLGFALYPVAMLTKAI